MASEAQKRELEAKVTALVAVKYGDDHRVAFDHYDADGNGVVNKDEVKALLADAGIGSGLTRWAWAEGIIQELDADGDGTISWTEFEAAFQDGKS